MASPTPNLDALLPEPHPRRDGNTPQDTCGTIIPIIEPPGLVRREASPDHDFQKSEETTCDSVDRFARETAALRLRRIVRGLKASNVSSQKRAAVLTTRNRALERQRLQELAMIQNVIVHLNCEICTFIMCSPTMLPNCGHTFCRLCIKRWFVSIHGRGSAAGHAPLSCPLCRVPVITTPVEVFTLKTIIATVTDKDNDPETTADLDIHSNIDNIMAEPEEVAIGKYWERFFG